VKKLVEKGIKVIVQSSSLRTFSDRQYIEVKHYFNYDLICQAGAVIQDDLSEANLIICVKEIPANLLLPDKTYMFFSHTIKAQAVNMPMLDDILQKVPFHILLFSFSEHSPHRLRINH
jgi:alpha-aminoadipic semialdehyde synthase